MYQPPYNLYPEIAPYQQSWLACGQSHQIYYEECGNPAGRPVVFLHGGPGSGCNPTQRRFFDPQCYRIILLDQRGCGRSKPQGETKHNTTADLVADLELLRAHLNIDTWHVFGGSWGSTLALAYATQHRDRVSALILRGIFLSRPAELDWFLGKVQYFYPDVWHQLLSELPLDEQADVLTAYEKRIFCDDDAVNYPAAVAWNQFENSIMRLNNHVAPAPTTAAPTEAALVKQHADEIARARIQLYYIRHRCFIDGDAILSAASQLTHIPTVIVQGRYDMVCPPQTAWDLANAMPHAELVMVPDAGHSAMEPGITAALVAATEKFKMG